MLRFWSKEPSKEERTYDWDVSGIDWSKYPKGKVLRSEDFSCGGVDGLFLEFYPKGTPGQLKEHEGWARFVLRRNQIPDGLWVRCKVSVDGVERKHAHLRDICVQKFWLEMPHQDAYNKITVEVLSVKRRCKPEDVALVACKPGDVLRVTKSVHTAAGVSLAYTYYMRLEVCVCSVCPNT